MSDPVYEAISKLNTLLQRIRHVELALGNGRIEKPLKLFVVSALATDESVPGGHLCMADKQFKPSWITGRGSELDLLALTKAPNSEFYECPRFWIELKSHLREDGKNGISREISKTLTQIEGYLAKLRLSLETEALKKGQPEKEKLFLEQLLNCPVYVVHFLGSTPSSGSKLSPLLRNKFPKQKDMTEATLKALYEQAAQARSWSGQVFDPIRIWTDPAVDAVVTRFDVRNGAILPVPNATTA